MFDVSSIKGWEAEGVEGGHQVGISGSSFLVLSRIMAHLKIPAKLKFCPSEGSAGRTE